MIGEILKYLRKTNKLKQSDVSKKINLAISTISGYETSYSEPTFDTIEKLADIYGYDIIFRNRTTKCEVTSKNINRIKY